MMENKENEKITNLISEDEIKIFSLFSKIRKSGKASINKLGDFESEIKKIKTSQDLIKIKNFETWEKLDNYLLNKWKTPFWNSKVLDFLSLYETVVIPSYQRNYQWTKQTIHKFLDSLTHNGSFNIGISILYESESEIFKKIEIVDGQQRITTMLIYILCYYKHIVNKGKDFNIIKNTLDNFGFVFELTDDKKDSKIHQTITSVIKDREFLDERKKHEIVQKIDLVDKNDIEEYFTSWIEKNEENADLTFLNLKKIKFIFKKTSDLSQAYEDFYNVNNISEKLTNWDNIRSIFYIKKYNESKLFPEFIKNFDKLLELKTVQKNKNPKTKALTIFGILVNNKFYTTNTSFAKIEKKLNLPDIDKNKFLRKYTKKMKDYINIEETYKNLNRNQVVALELAKLHSPDNYFELLIINFISNKNEISLKDALSFTVHYYNKSRKDANKWASNEFRNRINQLFKEKDKFDSIIDNLYKKIKIIPNSFGDAELKKPNVNIIKKEIDNIFKEYYGENSNRKYSLLLNVWDYNFIYGLGKNELTDEHLFSKSGKSKIDVESKWNLLPMEKEINNKLSNKKVCAKAQYLLTKCGNSKNKVKHKLIANEINKICISNNKDKEEKIVEYMKNRYKEINQNFINEMKK